jgi:hypothetical protein
MKLELGIDRRSDDGFKKVYNSVRREELYTILIDVKLEVFTAVTMKNDVFWDVTLCGSCKNRRFGEPSASFIRVTRICELGTTLAATSNRHTLRRNTRATLRNIPENTILHILIVSNPYEIGSAD